MATLPTASLVINENASAYAGATGYLVVAACVAQSADFVPRIMSSTQDILDEYLYNQGADYAAIHFAEANKPVIFVGMPIETEGSVRMQDQSGVTGSSQITVTVGADGCMEEIDGGIVTVTTGGTVGTSQIILSLSLDGGVSSQTVRLGTNSTYAIPNFGLTLNFGVGTLNAGDVFKFTTTAPMWSSTAMASLQTALAAQQNLARSWIIMGDLPSSTFAGEVVTAVDNYETENQRFVYARCSVSDRSPLATMSKMNAFMTADTSVTFAASGHTITRIGGSFLTDGFAIGDVVTVTGSASNNGNLGALTNVSATVLTFASGITNEGPDTMGVTISASPAITFAASGNTITRSSGNWETEGFAQGQSVSITGTASNNVTNQQITALSTTVMTLGNATLSNEGPSPQVGINVTQVLTMSGWVSNQTTDFATIDADKRIDLSLGRGIEQSPISGWFFRRPASWGASVREYQHDVQIPCWRKSDGPLEGFSLTDANGNTVEFDERTVGGGLAGRFTCFRSFANGPLGTFVALSLTRDTEGALLSRTHNLAVADVACTVVQTETENMIGDVLELNADGTGTEASLSQLEQGVNSALQINLLQDSFPASGAPAEGPRASNAVWTASRTDVLSSPGATLNGTLALELNGTLENISTSVVVS